MPSRFVVRAAAACVLVVASLSTSAAAQIELVAQTTGTEKAPRSDGDWVVWTVDPVETGSLGTVMARDLALGQTHTVGPGFRPDVTVTATGAGGCAAPQVRVAFLRWDGGAADLQLVSACFDGSAWTETLLATDLAWAEHVRVEGDHTAWSGSTSGEPVRVWVHDGAVTEPRSTTGQAFRPEFARLANGTLVLVWDAYLGPFDYEVYGSFLRPGHPWSPPVDLSDAPQSVDIEPTIAAAPDGTMWLAWQTDRGGQGLRTFVVNRSLAGVERLSQPFPASADPAEWGLLDLSAGLGDYEPHLHVDGQGRPWLFVESKPNGTGVGPANFDRSIAWTRYEADAWTAPALLPGEPRGERFVSTVDGPDVVRAVYQVNRQATRSPDIVRATLDAGGAAAAPVLAPSLSPPAPAGEYAAPVLPEQRVVLVEGVPHRLAFADFHSHSDRSPDGLGQLDHALFYARDVARLDAWASTDHDKTENESLMDWEYELGRRFLALYETPEFVTYVGFEWTNDSKKFQDEVIGHRATFDTQGCYRFSDPQWDSLSEFYAALNADGGIGVPHHLSQFGGTTFLQIDTSAQPISEVASLHGIFEDTLIEKLLGNGVRLGITAAGDNHSATPGYQGLAAILWEPGVEPKREALKTALRERRSFAVRNHGFWLEAHLNDRALGAEFAHAGDLVLRYSLDEVAINQPMTVSLTRDGDYDNPVYVRGIPPNRRIEEVAVIPGVPTDAFYMLRLGRLDSTLPVDALGWVTPFWVTAEPAGSYPVAELLPLGGPLSPTVPVTLQLLGTDPDGKHNLADYVLHVKWDGEYILSAPLLALLQVFQVSPLPEGWVLSLPGITLPPGEWAFILQLKDKQGHLAVDEVLYSVAE
ncbi:MAG: CehA/McbA family metallohydrolase domain-containing protein [Planctomycetota bacterium]|jgi:hypothetical protein